ncbi:MAG TPA: WGxxGxxG family protein [Allosphingosinicella sp.]|jgi:MYXO-CTERM domain-containing protein
MKRTPIHTGILAAAALATLSPAAAFAQDNAGATTGDEGGYTTRAEDDNDFPWGLLGLLGLAGLLGLKKRDRDIHVDARRNP